MSPSHQMYLSTFGSKHWSYRPCPTLLSWPNERPFCSVKGIVLEVDVCKGRSGIFEESSD